MDDARQRDLARSPFDALRSHPPKVWDQGVMGEYDQILTALEEAMREDLSSFRVPASEMRPKIVSFSRGRGATMSKERYCDEQFMRRRLEGIAAYLQQRGQELPARRAGRIEKTVFISYRRDDVAWAQSIFQDLTHHGYDVFFDFK
jgi:hypothetical protein